MEILQYPSEFLLTKTEKVTVFGEELIVLLDSMYECMIENRGMGLAANQVGLPHRMFVMNGRLGRINFVNPSIVNSSVKSANLKEGCLSFPGEFFIVPSRTSWIQIKYNDETGKECVTILSDLYAVCAQHEIDHLNAKVFIQDKSVPKYERKRLAKKWSHK